MLSGYPDGSPSSNDSKARVLGRPCSSGSLPHHLFWLSSVTDMSLPFSPNLNAVSFRIRLTWAPVSKRTFPRFWTPCPWILAVIIHKIALWVYTVAAVAILTGPVPLWRNVWWNWSHWMPFTDFLEPLHMFVRNIISTGDGVVFSCRWGCCYDYGYCCCYHYCCYCYRYI